MIVMGDIAHLKSTLIKTFLYRQCVFGRQFWILDVKGEYEPFARALGYPTIRLEPGLGVEDDLGIAYLRRGGSGSGDGDVKRLVLVFNPAVPTDAKVLKVALPTGTVELTLLPPPLSRSPSSRLLIAGIYRTGRTDVIGTTACRSTRA
jgi:hypothetical protein